MLNVILIIIFLVVVAMLWNEGMWGNAVSLLNVILAALIASNAWEPTADYLEEKAPSYTYILDFFSVWLIFIVVYAVMRAITDLLSRHRIRFKLPVEQTGRIVFAVWTAWVMVCFTTFTLHMAPLAKNSFRESFQSGADPKNFLGIGPDILWLGVVQSRSTGPLSRADQEGPEGVRKFDPTSTFMARYAKRRTEVEALEGLRVK